QRETSGTRVKQNLFAIRPFPVSGHPGGLGVGSSNLPAPTNKFKHLALTHPKLSAAYPQHHSIRSGVRWSEVVRLRWFHSSPPRGSAMVASNGWRETHTKRGAASLRRKTKDQLTCAWTCAQAK